MSKAQSGIKNNAFRVKALFDHIRRAAPTTAETAWLSTLEQDANEVRQGWRERFDAWLVGYEQAGGISAAVANELRLCADTCSSSKIRGEPVVFCLLWTILVTMATLAWQTKLIGVSQAAAGCIAIALTGIVWAVRAGWLTAREQASFPWWEQAAMTIAVGVGAVFLGVIVTGLFADLAKIGVYQAFKRQQIEFKEASLGYPWIRDFAQRQFAADVVMNSPENAWPRTTFQTVGNSPAYMSTGNGLCELSISRESIVNGFAGPDEQAVDIWIQGIMIHELAHCLDVRRDYAGRGGAWTGKSSIAPADRSDVDSGSSHYRIASERAPTQLWREVLADMMAIGYWRLNISPKTSQVLISELRARRHESDSRDPAHATTCWIDLASSAKAPTSNQQLFAWADQLRSREHCKLPVL